MNKMQLLVDTSVMIDFVRKPLKEEALFFRLGQSHSLFIAAVTEYEFLLGRNLLNADFTDSTMKQVKTLSMDSPVAMVAVEINHVLKQRNLLIGTNDIFIAATALHYDIPLATFNQKHFSRLGQHFGLQIIS
jgi:tRNA(fMet)-specific endonuclease VapC